MRNYKKKGTNAENFMQISLLLKKIWYLKDSRNGHFAMHYSSFHCGNVCCHGTFVRLKKRAKVPQRSSFSDRMAIATNRMFFRALSHLHVLTWRPEDVLGVQWKLPERGENAWFYLQIGFTVIYRVVSGDLKTSALRHLTSLSGLTASIPSLSRPGRVLIATTDKFMRRLSSSHHVFSEPITFAPSSWRFFRVRSTIRHVRMKH